MIAYWIIFIPFFGSVIMFYISFQASSYGRLMMSRRSQRKIRTAWTSPQSSREDLPLRSATVNHLRTVSRTATNGTRQAHSSVTGHYHLIIIYLTAIATYLSQWNCKLKMSLVKSEERLVSVLEQQWDSPRVTQLWVVSPWKRCWRWEFSSDMWCDVRLLLL